MSEKDKIEKEFNKAEEKTQQFEFKFKLILEIAKLREEKQELLEQLKLMTKMCKSIGTFENGVKWRGMDEGEGQAEGVICDSEKLIRKYEER